MKKISFNPSPVYLLTNVELAQFISDHLKHWGEIDSSKMTDQDMLALIATITTLLGGFRSLINKIRMSILTEGLSEADTNRDQSFRSLNSTLKTEIQSPDEDIRRAARLLRVLFLSYGKVVSLSYEAETQAIDNILSRMSSGEYKAAADLLGLERKTERLRADNETFKQIYQSRTKEMLVKEVTDTKEVRQQLLEAYSDLCNYALAMARFEKGEQYDEVVKVIDTIRAAYSAQAGRSTPRKPKDEASQE